MIRAPQQQIGLSLGFTLLPAPFGRRPRFLFAAEGRLHHPIIGLHPIFDGKGGMKEGLQRVIILLGDGFKLVVVALGALDGQSQETGSDDLLTGLQRIVAVHTNLIRITVRFPRAVLTVAQEMSRLQQVPDLGSHRIPRLPIRQFVPRQLLADPTVEGFVLVDRPDHGVAVAVGQRAVRIGAEVTVGIGIPHRIEPVLGPTFSVGRRSQVAFQPPLCGLGPVVGHKGLDVFRSRRQPGQHQHHPTQTSRRIRSRSQGQALGSQPCFDKAVQRRSPRRTAPRIGSRWRHRG